MRPFLFLVVSLLAGCNSGKGLQETCATNDECESSCCFPAVGTDYFCSAGDECIGGNKNSTGGGGGGGGGGGSSGACAYFDSKLSHIVCDPRSSASSCSASSGKFWSGGSCAGLSCPMTNDPQKCTNSTGGGGGGGSCTSTYNGPTGDAQVETMCKSVWNYRCQIMNDSAADQNCKVYDSLEATVSCPYC